MRRANGTGSVYKRTDAAHRHRPFVAVINLGMNAEGKRKKKLIGSYATRKEAQQALEIYNTSTPVEQKASRITFGQVWESYKAQRLQNKKPIDRAALSIYKTRVSPIAKMVMGDIRAIHLQEIVNTSGLGAVGQARILGIFHAVFKTALANDIVSKDYSRYVTAKAVQKSNIHKAFTTEEMRELWADDTNVINRIVLIQCYTGMRAGELAKMKRADVHLEDRYMVGGSKTEAGRNRTIPIAECIYSFIEDFYRISAFKKSPYLLAPHEGLLREGSMVAVAKIYEKLCLKSRHISHDARHTFITMASNYDIDPTITKLIVGHRQSDITTQVYTHKVKEQLIPAVNVLPHGVDMEMYKIGRQLEAIR